MGRFLDSVCEAPIVKCPTGPKMRIRVGDRISRSMLDERVLSPQVLEVCKGLRPGSLVIDIGANAGLLSLLAAQAVGPAGRVIAVEPLPESFAELLMNIQINGCKNILPLNVGLGIEPGESIMKVRNDHSGVAHISGSLEVAETDFSESNPVAIIDGAIPERILPTRPVAFVKIDGEGAELSVVRSLRSVLLRTACVAVEVTPRFLQRHQHDKESLYKELKSLGFRPTVESSDWQYDEVFIRD